MSVGGGQQSGLESVELREEKSNDRDNVGSWGSVV